MTAVKQQKSSKDLACYFLMRWFITEVSVIIIYQWCQSVWNIGGGPFPTLPYPILSPRVLSPSYGEL
jgi:hypothetical protein